MIGTLTQNVWAFAVVRYKTSIFCFLNGVLGSTTAIAQNVAMSPTSCPLWVGGANAANCYFQGNIDELRVTKGLALWTAPFTPPISPYTYVAPALLTAGKVPVASAGTILKDSINIQDDGTNAYLSGLKFPNVDGTAGYVLQTNGARSLSWVANAGATGAPGPAGGSPYISVDTTFYVATTGNDTTGDGSSAQPLGDIDEGVLISLRVLDSPFGPRDGPNRRRHLFVGHDYLPASLRPGDHGHWC